MSSRGDIDRYSGSAVPQPRPKEIRREPMVTVKGQTTKQAEPALMLEQRVRELEDRLEATSRVLVKGHSWLISYFVAMANFIDGVDAEGIIRIADLGYKEAIEATSAYDKFANDVLRELKEMGVKTDER